MIACCCAKTKIAYVCMCEIGERLLLQVCVFISSKSKNFSQLRIKESKHQVLVKTWENQNLRLIEKLLFSDWVCTAVISNDVMKDLRG